MAAPAAEDGAPTRRVPVQGPALLAAVRAEPLAALVLAVFAVGVAPGIAFPGGMDKQVIIARTLAEAGLLALGFAVLAGRYLRRGHAVDVPRGHRPVFACLALWVGVTLVAGVVGLLDGYDTTHEGFPHEFLIGDLYKFLALPATFLLVYAAVRSGVQVEFLLRGLVAASAVAYVGLLATLAQGHQAQFSALFVPSHAAVLPVLLHGVLRWSGRWRALAGVALAQSYAVTALGQSAFVMLIAVLVPAAFVVLGARRPARAAVAVGGGFAASAWVLAGMAGPIVAGADAFGGRFAAKVRAVLGPAPFLERMESLAGGRLSELTTAIVVTFQEPARLLLGRGLGSSILTIAIVPEFAGGAGVLRHNMHSGIGEALFRAGLPGLVVLSAFIVLFGSWAWRARGSPHGLLALVGWVAFGAGMVVGTPLAAGFLLPSLLFTAALRAAGPADAAGAVGASAPRAGEPAAVAGLGDTPAVVRRGPGEDRRNADWRFLTSAGPGARVLVLGVGDGGMATSLARAGMEVWVADRDEALLSALPPDPRLHAVPGAPAGPPVFPPGSLDLVCVRPTWGPPTVPDLAALRALLRPGGTLCLLLPNRLSFRRLLRPGRGRGVRTLAGYRRLLRAAGFPRVEAHAPLPDCEGVPLFYVPLDEPRAMHYFLAELAGLFELASPEAKRAYRLDYILARAGLRAALGLRLTRAARWFVPGFALLARRPEA